MPRTVYAASSGSYSDYSVDLLFEDRADAEAHVKQTNDDGPEWARGTPRVEEFEFWEAGSRPELRVVYYAFVRNDSKDDDISISHDVQRVDEGDLARPKERVWETSARNWAVSVQGWDRELVKRRCRELADSLRAREWPTVPS
jgi:hypothetical protein